MSYLLSPSVELREFDETLSIQADNTAVAGFAGAFNWGPAHQIMRVDSVRTLEKTFGLQGASNTDFLIASQFLAYSNNLRVVRAISGTAANATASSSGLLIKNDEHYNASYSEGQAAVGTFAAKYPGAKGNGLIVAYADSQGWSVTKTGYTAEAGSTTLTSTGLTAFNVGDEIWVAGVKVATITAIGGATTATLDTSIILGDDSPATSATFSIRWKHAANFNFQPGTSVWATDHSSSNDELHVLVIDGAGVFSGVQGTVLEKYEFLSKAADAKLDNGESNYYKNVINAKSKYIRWMDHDAAGTNWGYNANAVTYDSLGSGKIVTLSGGVDGSVTSGNKLTAFQIYLDGGADEIGVLFAGDTGSDNSLANGVIAVAQSLRFTEACVSPKRSDVVDNEGNEVDSIINFKSSLTGTDRAFVDSGWKLTYDQYNARWIYLPLNADVAGLMVNAETKIGISASPADPTISAIQNCVKLAFNPNETERDVLYPNSVNCVVTFPGQGTVLFGDRTAIVRPSAFRYVGARRMFNLVEKSLTKSSKNFLFKRNTPAERSRYANQIRGFLNTIKDNEDIEDFRVKVDSSNNTPELIASQVLVADVYIKPVYSINWVLLNMHAVQTGASFTETVQA